MQKIKKAVVSALVLSCTYGSFISHASASVYMGGDQSGDNRVADGAGEDDFERGMAAVRDASGGGAGGGQDLKVFNGERIF